jgi:hypothetical protein
MVVKKTKGSGWWQKSPKLTRPENKTVNKTSKLIKGYYHMCVYYRIVEQRVDLSSEVGETMDYCMILQI